MPRPMCSDLRPRAYEALGHSMFECRTVGPLVGHLRRQSVVLLRRCAISTCRTSLLRPFSFLDSVEVINRPNTSVIASVGAGALSIAQLLTKASTRAL